MHTSGTWNVAERGLLQSLKLTSDRPPDPGKFYLGLIKDKSYPIVFTGKHNMCIISPPTHLLWRRDADAKWHLW